MDKMQIELAEVIERYFGADAGYLDIDCFTLAKRIMEAGWEKPVRCKGCKYYMLWEDSEDKCTCGKSIGLMSSDPDDFCSYGERKEVNK